MMFQTHDSLYLQVATKRATLEKQAILARQLREISTPRSLRNRLAGTLHHLAEKLAPEYVYSPRTNAA